MTCARARAQDWQVLTWDRMLAESEEQAKHSVLQNDKGMESSVEEGAAERSAAERTRVCREECAAEDRGMESSVEKSAAERTRVWRAV